MGGKNASAPQADPKELWGNYSRWVTDTNKLYDNKISSAKARMSAGGMQAGTDDWNREIESLENKRADELATHKKSTTYQLLEQSRIRETRGSIMGNSSDDDYPTDEDKLAREEADAERDRLMGMSIEDYYTEKYGGETAGGEEAPEDTTAPDEQRRPRGKTIVADQPSPWMGGA